MPSTIMRLVEKKGSITLGILSNMMRSIPVREVELAAEKLVSDGALSVARWDHRFNGKTVSRYSIKKGAP